MKKKKKSFWISIPTFFVTNFQARLNRVLEKAADGDDGRRPPHFSIMQGRMIVSLVTLLSH
jgi:hypothetical protein